MWTNATLYLRNRDLTYSCPRLVVKSAEGIGTHALCLLPLKPMPGPSKPTLHSALVRPPCPQQISSAIRSPGAGDEFAGELLRHSSGMGKAGERRCAISLLAPWMDQLCLLRLEARRFALANWTGRRGGDGFPWVGDGGPSTVECWETSTMVEEGACCGGEVASVCQNWRFLQWSQLWAPLQSGAVQKCQKPLLHCSPGLPLHVPSW